MARCGSCSALGVDPLKDVDTLFVATPPPGRRRGRRRSRPHRPGSLPQGGRGCQPQDSRRNEDPQRRCIDDLRGKHGSDPAFATFPTKGTLLLSPSRTALTAAASGTAKLGQDIAGVVAQVDGRQSVWVAALLPDDAKRALTKQPQTAELAAKIKGFTVVLNVDRDIQTTLNVLTTEAKAAESIAELLEGLKGLGKLYAASVPQIGPHLGQAMDSVKVATSQATVTATLQVSEQTIDQVVKAAQRHPPCRSPRRCR
jgi:hypothetical protein